MYINETIQNTVPTVQNTIDTSTNITKTPTLYIRASVSLLHFCTDLDTIQLSSSSSSCSCVYNCCSKCELHENRCSESGGAAYCTVRECPRCGDTRTVSDICTQCECRENRCAEGRPHDSY